ncbi:hypothetical protein [Methylobacterium nodulans]|uniref:Uncharacterized protein n=1 Tax=Methylobacterium nodulans (strain LMG 21967 / CNCM I-2342 / ORS 2060) TaxID=460265 RepID=B8IEF4_METNO|nr:hypothetical protein [Methylobacterium nodulans]ACL59526.1 hypothetical protein Mnod_4659 [Methylobacterium nodulans ORS 2060]
MRAMLTERRALREVRRIPPDTLAPLRESADHGDAGLIATCERAIALHTLLSNPAVVRSMSDDEWQEACDGWNGFVEAVATMPAGSADGLAAKARVLLDEVSTTLMAGAQFAWDERERHERLVVSLIQDLLRLARDDTGGSSPHRSKAG